MMSNNQEYLVEKVGIFTPKIKYVNKRFYYIFPIQNNQQPILNTLGTSGNQYKQLLEPLNN